MRRPTHFLFKIVIRRCYERNFVSVSLNSNQFSTTCNFTTINTTIHSLLSFFWTASKKISCIFAAMLFKSCSVRTVSPLFDVMSDPSGSSARLKGLVLILLFLSSREGSYKGDDASFFFECDTSLSGVQVTVSSFII